MPDSTILAARSDPHQARGKELVSRLASHASRSLSWVTRIRVGEICEALITAALGAVL
jgi:hypothetical protein